MAYSLRQVHNQTMNTPRRAAPQTNRQRTPNVRRPNTAPNLQKHIQTSITPQRIYSGPMTRDATNQAVARQHQRGNLPHILNQMSRPGMSSHSPAMMAQAMPQVSQAYTQANVAREQIPFQDAYANARHLLAGQTAREHEAIGLGNLQNTLAAQNRAFSMSQIGPLMAMLGQYF